MVKHSFQETLYIASLITWFVNFYSIVFVLYCLQKAVPWNSTITSSIAKHSSGLKLSVLEMVIR